MTHVEIVTHCWRYASLLACQASSLALYPPKGDVRVTLAVYCSREDERTIGLLDRLDDAKLPENVAIERQLLETPSLMRRAIGRNLAARGTTADIVWFADCDYLFRFGTFAALVREIVSRPDGMLYHPRQVLINVDWADGDETIERARSSSGWIDLDETKFSARSYGRAIGGMQIVRGDVARRHGYVPFGRFQKPIPTWQATTEDVRFRKLLGPPQYAIDVPGVYRIRNLKRSANGRSTSRCITSRCWSENRAVSTMPGRSKTGVCPTASVCRDGVWRRTVRRPACGLTSAFCACWNASAWLSSRTPWSTLSTST